MSEPSLAAPPGEGRQKALQEELRELVDVVGPVPLVDLLLERAFQLRATDIHLDPTPDGLRVRLRVDGILHDVLMLPADVMPAVISRVKLMASMDITERRFAQDGHISGAALRHQRDVRVGSGPTIHGERLVLRLMPDTASLSYLDELGLEPDQTDLLKRCLDRPHGVLLSVGPVGSGKSTTLYSCLGRLNEQGRSLVTIEDPVERRLEGVNQIQVDPRIEFNFVEALRGVLRQDPDVIMVGEIRDPETAHIAVRAGLTGIRVLSSLHANDSASTLDVFRDFGVPAIFIADSVNGIIAQRLLRKVCEHCRTTWHPDPRACHLLGVDPKHADSIELARGQGCDACFRTGYSGRTGVFEIMLMTEELRNAILQGATGRELHEVARRCGMQTLEQSALRKVRAGVTTFEEMHRVLMAE